MASTWLFFVQVGLIVSTYAVAYGAVCDYVQKVRNTRIIYIIFTDCLLGRRSMTGVSGALITTAINSLHSSVTAGHAWLELDYVSVW